METATKAIENVPFRDRIAKLDESALRTLADEEFGLTIDGQLKKEAIVKQLVKIYEETTNAARTLNEQSAMLFLEADENERLIAVKFMPLDFPNAPVDFSNDGGLGLRGKKLGKGQKKPPNWDKGLRKMPVFKFIPGETYKLPIRLIKILEDLTFRGSKPQHDPVTGMISGNMPVIKPRFMLTPVLSDEQMREMGTTQ